MAFSRDPNLTAGSLTNDEIKHRILDIFATFVSDVEPTPMSDWLIQEKVITTEQWKEICHKNHTSRSQCRGLLVHLFSIHHPKAFLFVRQALIKENHYLLEFIDNQEPGCEIREQPDNQTLLQATTATTMKTTFERKGEKVVTHKAEPIEYQKSGDESKQTTKPTAAPLNFRRIIHDIIEKIKDWCCPCCSSVETRSQGGENIPQSRVPKDVHCHSDKNLTSQLENCEDKKSAAWILEKEDRLLQLRKNIESIQHEIKQLETELLEAKLQVGMKINSEEATRV